MKMQKPWTDENGNLLSDGKLRAASAGWSQEIWNEYLATLEYTPRSDEEVCIGSSESLDSFATSTFADLLPSSIQLSDELLEDMKRAIEELPPLERFVMEEGLYGGKSQRTIAMNLGCSRAWVQKIRKKAFDLLAKKLAKHRSS